MKKLVGCVLILFIQNSILYSQYYDTSIYNTVSKSMNFNKWEEINSISVVFDYKQKKSNDNTSFSDLESNSKESLLIDKSSGIKHESTGDNFTMIEKINKKYLSFSSIFNGIVTKGEPEISYFDDENDYKKLGFNFIKNNSFLEIVVAINLFTRYKDSLVFINTTTLNNNICKVYGTKSFENPELTFLINEDYKIVCWKLKELSSYYFMNYSNYDGLIFPETIYSVLEPYKTFKKLLNLKQNIKFPENIFY